jgi:hypothetical protein
VSPGELSRLLGAGSILAYNVQYAGAQDDSTSHHEKQFFSYPAFRNTSRENNQTGNYSNTGDYLRQSLSHMITVMTDQSDPGGQPEKPHGVYQHRPGPIFIKDQEKTQDYDQGPAK